MKRYNARKRPKRAPKPTPTPIWKQVHFPARIDPRDGSTVCEAKMDEFKVSTMAGLKAYNLAIEALSVENRLWADCEAHLRKEMEPEETPSGQQEVEG